MEAICRPLQASLFQQDAQQCQLAHHAVGRTGARFADRLCSAAFGKSPLRLCFGFPHPGVSLPLSGRGDVPRVDQQRGRHNPGPAGLVARTQSQRSAELLCAAKGVTLAAFAVIQCILFTLVGNALLSVRGVFWIVFVAMFLTTMSGVAIGLVISALVNESKTAVLAIPVVLIPQIILAGALIKYEDMNRDLDFVYSIRQWAARHPTSAMEPRSDLTVPFICSLMPMRWSYEALVFAQSKMNPLTRRQENIQRQIDELAALPNPSPAQE